MAVFVLPQIVGNYGSLEPVHDAVISDGLFLFSFINQFGSEVGNLAEKCTTTQVLFSGNIQSFPAYNQVIYFRHIRCYLETVPLTDNVAQRVAHNRIVDSSDSKRLNLKNCSVCH